MDGLLSAWQTADVVCLGEGHASRNDADLRLSLIRDPRFPSVVDVVVVEFAADSRQALLDRFLLDGAALSRDELAPVWRDTRQDVWESPVYEESAYGFFDEEEGRRGRRLFGLGERPAYVVVRGTKWQTQPAKGMFRFQEGLTLGDMLDAIVWYGDTPDSIVPAKPRP